MFLFYKRLQTISAHGLLIPLVLLLLGALVTGCGDEEGNPLGNNTPPPIEVTSGLFDVTSWIIFDTCNSTTVHADSYVVQIDTLTFSMGDDWVGAWYPKTVTGKGESERELTEIVTRNGICKVTKWTSVEIMFSSEDEFKGEIIYRRRVDLSCVTPCLTTWRVEGVRRQPVQ
jgi:hypothetical protein